MACITPSKVWNLRVNQKVAPMILVSPIRGREKERDSESKKAAFLSLSKVKEEECRTYQLTF